MTRVGFGNVCHALNVTTVIDSVQRGRSDKTYFFKFRDRLKSDNERRQRGEVGGGGWRLTVIIVRLRMSKKKKNRKSIYRMVSQMRTVGRL